MPSDVQDAKRYGLFIDNESRPPSSGAYIDVADPYTGETWTQVPDASAADVDAAIASARKAFTSGPWADTIVPERARLLRRFGDLLGDHAEELAELQVRENGKLMREMVGQMKLLPDHFHYYAGLAQTHGGRTNPVHLPGMMNYTVRQPLGVVAAVTPWNSPILLLAWKLGPALATGNTLVAKPSEITPVSTLRLAELAVEAGLPPGVFNVITGLADPAGRALSEHPGVDKIAVTGSTATGRAIATAAGSSLTRLSLELGGKSPNVVFDDADLDVALNGMVAGIFGASGQSCMAGSRILVQDSIYDEVVTKLAERAKKIKLGDPRADDTEMGTVASPAQFEKVLRYFDIAQDDGARLAAGGQRATGPGLDQGLFVQPTVFADVTNDMRIAREEVFGPVASVLKFADEDEALQIANDTEFGLAAGVWTLNLPRAHRMASKLRAGTVWINNYRKTSYLTPFGGFDQSGVGRENGPDALYEYTEEKSVWVDVGQGVKDPFNPRA
ncbi:MAG: aldehyde dehydrogenase family protein [Streptosporangiales bacterium]|nr:aldehyde dehydrogenase family protein [Streptosporangiales bacterium]